MATDDGNKEVAVKRVVTYQPLAPVGSAGDLKALLDTQKASLAQALPKHVTPERIIKTLLVAANRTPDLLQCTQASVLETISRAGELGLDLSGTLGEAYPVPFNNRVKGQWYKQCQLIIGYRGLAKLARQSGEIKRIEAEVVYEQDKFTYKKGVTFVLDFEPCIKGDRGEPIGAYALVEFKDGGIQAEFMPVSDIEKIRMRSKSGADDNGNPIGAWKSDWSEMAKKTVFRRLAKWMPLSAEKFNAALETDADDFNLTEVLEVKALPRGAAGVAAKLGLTEQPPEVIDEPQEQQQPTDEPQAEPELNTALNQLSVALANKDGCTVEEAADRIVAKCGKFRGNVTDLKPQQIKSLEGFIADGSL